MVPVPIAAMDEPKMADLTGVGNPSSSEDSLDGVDVGDLPVASFDSSAMSGDTDGGGDSENSHAVPQMIIKQDGVGEPRGDANAPNGNDSNHSSENNVAVNSEASSIAKYISSTPEVDFQAIFSLPYFAKSDNIINTELGVALTSRAWAEPDDSLQLVVIKNLIVLFQIVNNFQDCYPPADDKAAHWWLWNHMSWIWAVVPKRKPVLVIGPKRDPLALVAVRLFTHLRRIHQVEVEDHSEYVTPPQNPLLNLLIQLVHERQRFLDTGVARHRFRGSRLRKKQLLRTEAIVRVAQNEKQELFNHMWITISDRAASKRMDLTFRGITEHHRQKTARRVRKLIARSELGNGSGLLTPRSTPPRKVYKGGHFRSLRLRAESEGVYTDHAGSFDDDAMEVDKQSKELGGVLPSEGTGLPWKIHVRIDQRLEEVSPGATRPSLVLTISGPVDLGQDINIDVSAGWEVSKTWSGVIGDVPPVSKGTHFGTGEVLSSWLHYKQDNSCLVAGETPQCLNVTISSKKHIGQDIYVDPVPFWPFSGPYNGKPNKR